MCVAEVAGDADLVDRERFGVDLSAPALGLMPQCINGCDAQNVAIQLAGQVVIFKHDVQRLVPWNVIEHDRQIAVDRWIEHNVQTADLVNQAEEVFQIYILEVDRDRLPRGLSPPPSPALA